MEWGGGYRAIGEWYWKEEKKPTKKKRKIRLERHAHTHTRVYGTCVFVGVGKVKKEKRGTTKDYTRSKKKKTVDGVPGWGALTVCVEVQITIIHSVL